MILAKFCKRTSQRLSNFKLATMDPNRRKGPIEDRNQTALNQSKKGKTLEDSFGLLFDLVEELRLIQEELEIGRNPILIILHRYREELMDMSLGELSLGETYHLLLYLEEDISVIQNDLGIVGYTNPEISGLEADKNARAYLQKFRRSLAFSAFGKRCSKCGNTEIHR